MSADIPQNQDIDQERIALFIASGIQEEREEERHPAFAWKLLAGLTLIWLAVALSG